MLGPVVLSARPDPVRRHIHPVLEQGDVVGDVGKRSHNVRKHSITEAAMGVVTSEGDPGAGV